MTHRETYLDPAATVIAQCFGVANVAKASGHSKAWVARWRLAKDKGGTGGKVPHDAGPKLVAAAVANNWPLTPRDFVCHLEASHRAALDASDDGFARTG